MASSTTKIYTRPVSDNEYILHSLNYHVNWLCLIYTYASIIFFSNLVITINNILKRAYVKTWISRLNESLPWLVFLRLNSKLPLFVFMNYPNWKRTRLLESIALTKLLMTENMNVFVSSFCLSVLLLFRHFPRVRKNSLTIFDVSEELDFCRDILVKVCDVDTCGVEASAGSWLSCLDESAEFSLPSSGNSNGG